MVRAAGRRRRATSLSSMMSWCCSSLLDMVHSVTRPSLDTEANESALDRSSSCQATCQTGSLCLPVRTVDSKMGLGCFCRMSSTATEPSYIPTASRLVCVGWKSTAITPDSKEQMYSGCDGFFSE